MAQTLTEMLLASVGQQVHVPALAAALGRPWGREFELDFWRAVNELRLRGIDFAPVKGKPETYAVTSFDRTMRRVSNKVRDGVGRITRAMYWAAGQAERSDLKEGDRARARAKEDRISFLLSRMNK